LQIPSWEPAIPLAHFPGFPDFNAIDFPANVGYYTCMSFPIRTCVVCGDEFELRPDKPGFANRCPSCSEPESTESDEAQPADFAERLAEAEMNAARRRAIRDLLYRKES
jgi:hypothetical protein